MLAIFFLTVFALYHAYLAGKQFTINLRTAPNLRDLSDHVYSALPYCTSSKCLFGH